MASRQSAGRGGLLRRLFRKEPLTRAGLVVFGGLLLALSFPPVSAPGLGWLAWVALVPWLATVAGSKGWSSFVQSYLFGLAFFLVGTCWIGHVTLGGLAVLTAYLAVYPALLGLLACRLRSRWRLPFSVTVPFLWVGLEYIRGILFTGFPWLFLGYSQFNLLTLIQASDLVGVYGISFLIVAVNAVLAEAVRCVMSDKGRAWLGRAVIVPGAASLALLAATLWYGNVRLARDTFQEGPRLAVVQGNIPQEVKSVLDSETFWKMLEVHSFLSLQVAQDEPGVEMIVWPETMVPGVLNRCDIIQSRIQRLAEAVQTRLLLGGIAIEVEGEGKALREKMFNSAYYTPRGDADVDKLKRYDKIHLVPFGEYIPLADVVPILKPFVPYEEGFRKGTEAKTFALDGACFGVCICYEDAFPALVRRFARNGAQFLINITNDGWFKRSAELDQHLGMSVFRAVENRVGFVRATNTGISGFVSPDGRVQSILRENGQYKEVAGYLVDRVKLGTGQTLYNRIGDSFAWGCLLCAVALLLLSASPAIGTPRRM